MSSLLLSKRRSIRWIVLSSSAPLPIDKRRGQITIMDQGSSEVLPSWDLAEDRDFRYLTPKLQITPNDLSPTLLASKTFHIISNPIRAKSTVNDILFLRHSRGIEERPVFFWEPVPGVCSPDDWEDCLNAMKVVDVISPNVHEAGGFLGRTIDEEQPFEQIKDEIEELAREYTSHRIGNGGAVVLRCGKHGCLISTGEMVRWLPAFHQSGEMVVDPTGGGNAFCGGFCAGWVQSGGDIITAGIYGNIAASFVIEQYGLPVLKVAEGNEIWNGDTVEQRRKAYEARL